MTNDIIEHFCGACIAAPLMMIGSSATITSNDKEGTKQDTMFFWGGVVLTIVSAILFIYYRRTCKACR